jgi:hypothetical protein
MDTQEEKTRKHISKVALICTGTILFFIGLLSTMMYVWIKLQFKILSIEFGLSDQIPAWQNQEGFGSFYGLITSITMLLGIILAAIGLIKGSHWGWVQEAA